MLESSVHFLFIKNRKCRSFDYKQIVEEAGYKGAAATNRGYDRFNKDAYELNRIRFSDKDDRNDYLWIKLSGYYNLFRAAKKPY